MAKEEKEKIVLVVAKSYDQFVQEIRYKFNVEYAHVIQLRQDIFVINGTKYIYMSRPESMLGYHGVTVEYWGQYYMREDIGRFRELQRNAERE